MEKIFEAAAENPEVKVGEILDSIELTAEEYNGKPAVVVNADKFASLKTKWILTKSRLQTIATLIKAMR